MFHAITWRRARTRQVKPFCAISNTCRLASRTNSAPFLTLSSVSGALRRLRWRGEGWRVRKGSPVSLSLPNIFIFLPFILFFTSHTEDCPAPPGPHSISPRSWTPFVKPLCATINTYLMVNIFVGQRVQQIVRLVHVGRNCNLSHGLATITRAQRGARVKKVIEITLPRPFGFVSFFSPGSRNPRPLRQQKCTSSQLTARLGGGIYLSPFESGNPPSVGSSWSGGSVRSCQHPGRYKQKRFHTEGVGHNDMNMTVNLPLR